MKKIMSVLLALCLVLAMVPVAASAEDGKTPATSVSDFSWETIDNSYVKIKEYKGNAENVVIPETINGLPVTTIGAEAFRDNETVKFISGVQIVKIDNGYVAPNNMTQGAFSRSKVEKVDFPNLVYIGTCAFTASPLSEIDFSNVENIGAYAFAYSKITVAELPALKSLGRASFASTPLERVSSPQNFSMNYSDDKEKTLPVGTFDSCKKLKEVEFPNLQTLGIGTFTGCSSLKTISLPSLTSLGKGEFRYCSNLESVDFPSLKSLSAYNYHTYQTSMGYTYRYYYGTFAHCTSLKKARFPALENLRQYSLISSSLEEIELPSLKATDKYSLSYIYDDNERYTPLHSLKKVAVPCTYSGQDDMVGKDLLVPTHNLEKVEATEPTAKDPGNIEYWKCTTCNGIFKDSYGQEIIDLSETIIPPAPSLGSGNTEEPGNGSDNSPDEGDGQGGDDETNTGDSENSSPSDSNENPDGGADASQTFEIEIADTENGKVTVSPTSPKEDATVTITATPDEHYKVGTVTVTEKDGTRVTVTAKDGKYTFTQPDSTVTVTVTFVWDNPFTDVGNAWYTNAVEYVHVNGLMAGTSETTFAPNTKLNRAMAVQILYNLEGQPTVTGETTFTDAADAGGWAVKAITWAEQTGVVAGIGDGLFAPTANVTREQFAQMMYNYADYKGYDLTKTGDLEKFEDASSISSWAETAMSWANGNGLINGHEDTGLIDPAGTATRAQAASIIMNFDLNLVK